MPPRRTASPAQARLPIRRSRIPRGLQQFLTETRRVMQDPSLLLWSLYILLFPIYVVPSGLPQPGDWLVLLLVPAVFARRRARLPRVAIPATRALLFFTAYLILVNLTWTVAIDSYSFSPKDGFLLTPLWYIYNALFFVCVLVLYNQYGERFLWLTLQLTLLSVALQSAISLVYTGGGYRGMVTFNSPNQLGYFAVLSATILVLGRRRLGLGTIPATLGLLGCAYLALLSSSKAALGATAILIFVSLLNNPRIVVIACIGFLSLITFSNPVLDAFEHSQERIATDESHGFFEERGYDRIVNNKEYWLFGAGEGGYRRFSDTTIIGSHELHSSIGTIFFSYGILGLLLFTVFCWRLASGSSIRRVLLLMPAAAYGLTHQGLRFTLLWVLLAMFLALWDHDRNVQADPGARPGGPRPSRPRLMGGPVR